MTDTEMFQDVFFQTAAEFDTFLSTKPTSAFDTVELDSHLFKFDPSELIQSSSMAIDSAPAPYNKEMEEEESLRQFTEAMLMKPPRPPRSNVSTMSTPSACSSAYTSDGDDGDADSRYVAACNDRRLH